ncbi:hypothetical protein J2W91_002444 [Paenibacillus amylolyticus]|uniref:Uncharacterized protein n=1 Tax=Paenibacillus amylolyticus TaxID=1451 RepID=A0AAP5LM06_PAEAM|nr:hypothetical protein [Paenibacillus amylolyticus]MDR6723982.1 hypothetical protein [Paenibacillus amylolyticus]
MPLIDNYLIDNSLIDGPPKGIQYASGQVLSSNTTDTFHMSNGSTTSGLYFVTVNGSEIGFVPDLIVVTMDDPSGSLSARTSLVYGVVYDSTLPKDSGGYANYLSQNSYSSVTTYIGRLRSPAYVDATGFKFPVTARNGVSHAWKAFKFT